MTSSNRSYVASAGAAKSSFRLSSTASVFFFLGVLSRILQGPSIEAHPGRDEIGPPALTSRPPSDKEQPVRARRHTPGHQAKPTRSAGLTTETPAAVSTKSIDESAAALGLSRTQFLIQRAEERSRAATASICKGC